MDEVVNISTPGQGRRGLAKSQAILAGVVALVLAAGGMWYLAGEGEETPPQENLPPHTPPLTTGTEVGQLAPDFTLVDIDDKTFSLSDYRGKIVVIDFMATWCGPCVAEMAHLQELHSNYHDQIMIMSIDVDPNETNQVIKQFKANYGGDWIFASGPNVGATYKVTAIPTLYIIDKQGRIVYKNVGLTPYSTLAAEIDKLLQGGTW